MRNEPERKIRPREFQGDIGRRIFAAVASFFLNYVFLTLTLRLLMSCIYMEHLFLMFLDHTQRRSTVGRTPLDE